jgi:hypothetical protein
MNWQANARNVAVERATLDDIDLVKGTLCEELDDAFSLIRDI